MERLIILRYWLFVMFCYNPNIFGYATKDGMLATNGKSKVENSKNDCNTINRILIVAGFKL